MLEFYQVYSNFEDLMDLTETLLTELVRKVCGTLIVAYNDHAIDFVSWSCKTMKEAIVEFLPPEAGRVEAGDLEDAGRVRDLLDRVRADCRRDLPLGNLVGELFERVAEHRLIQPTLIYEYPIEMSPLSKARSDDPSVAERFELYIAGMEIANGYSELNDPVDQRRRFESQLEAREQGDDEAHSMDDDYIRALSYGMPPTAGEGIGVDRLVMLLTNSKTIRDVILFPHLRPE
jgi:lysyl-tRNA synthetase class 2